MKLISTFPVPRRLLLALPLPGLLAVLGGRAGAAEESIEDVIRRLQAQERDKAAVCFDAGRSPAQVARLLSYAAPDLHAVNLGPTGVTQTSYAELTTHLNGRPGARYRLGVMRVVRNNEQSLVLSYRAEITTPGGPVGYLASSMWSRGIDGRWLTVFYQATPLP
ncbi:hypothetical protein [Roseateles sp.]|uniref:hypothetical protein n=1 Tax=Roseateles sp. TaxID=1971397 RepID=UPI0025F0582A|nr:hypothetical protein [Roseateles sp.]MBV8034224.1 hypothetical protein [Roseateles sp.]